MQLHVTQLYMSQLNMIIRATDGVNGALSQGGAQPGRLPEVLHNGNTSMNVKLLWLEEGDHAILIHGSAAC
jgi:hypothetical protein